MARPALKLAAPELQIGFAHRLVALRQTHLQPALLAAVATLDISALDGELAVVAPAQGLRKLASLGLRGEVLFSVPLVLQARPKILTYYRTLLGYSQKEFYQTGTGLGIFKRAEEHGEWGITATDRLTELCELMNSRAWQLLQGIDALPVDQRFLNELSLLSIGPQLRGGRNNQLGDAGIEAVFQLIVQTISRARPVVVNRTATITNAAGRQVVVAVAADPDIVIIEKSAGYADRPLVAIEVKAGTDASNIHNRIGEAEKSHLKAKARKFTDCWTILNIARRDVATVAQQSPTTNRFFTLADLMDEKSSARKEFTGAIVSFAGIRARPGRAKSTK